VKLPAERGGSLLTPVYACSFEYGVGHKWLPQYSRWWKIGEPLRWVDESDDEARHYYQVNAPVLLIQWFLVSAVTGIIVMFLRAADKPDKGKAQLEGIKYGRPPRSTNSEQEQ
jgi:hypothetical protein